MMGSLLFRQTNLYLLLLHNAPQYASMTDTYKAQRELPLRMACLQGKVYTSKVKRRGENKNE
jgi:hypothetical protein